MYETIREVIDVENWGTLMRVKSQPCPYLLEIKELYG